LENWPRARFANSDLVLEYFAINDPMLYVRNIKVDGAKKYGMSQIILLDSRFLMVVVRGIADRG